MSYTLYVIRCTLYVIRHTLNAIRYTLYVIRYTLYVIRCALHVIGHTLYGVRSSTLYTIRCTLHAIRYTLYAIRCMLCDYVVRYMLYVRRYTLYVIRYTLYVIRRTRHTIRYTLHATRYTPAGFSVRVPLERAQGARADGCTFLVIIKTRGRATALRPQWEVAVVLLRDVALQAGPPYRAPNADFDTTSTAIPHCGRQAVARPVAIDVIIMIIPAIMGECMIVIILIMIVE